MAEPAWLELIDVELMAGPRPLLSGVHLRLEAGRLVALVGPSGAGKSALVRACLGLLPRGLTHTRGEIRAQAGGRGFVRRPGDDSAPIPAPLRRELLGLLPQDGRASLVPMRTVGAQLRAARRAAGQNDDDGALMDALAGVGMHEGPAVLRALPHQLSGGQAQRVALALALCPSPALLLADEPTTGLDSHVQAEVAATLRREADAGRGLLLITHDLALVRRVADSVYRLEAKGLIGAGALRPTCGAGTGPWSLSSEHPGGSDLAPQAGEDAIASARAPASRTEAPALVELRQVHRRFAAGWPWARRVVDAVQDVSLTIHEGEVLGICGASGSGKTTLARILAGAEAPTAGHVRWAPGIADQVQLLFQQPDAHIDPRWTVGALLAESADAARRRRRTPMATDAVDNALAGVGLEGRGADRAGTLSGGERRRVGIARVQLMAPMLWIADEPTAGVDADLRAGLLSTVQKARAAADPRAALVLISHDLGVLRAAAGRIVVMQGGRIIEELPTTAMGQGPHHPFTWTLLVAAGLASGTVTPTTALATDGCPNRLGCRAADARCTVIPALRAVGSTHTIACHQPPHAPPASDPRAWP